VVNTPQYENNRGLRRLPKALSGNTKPAGTWLFYSGGGR